MPWHLVIVGFVELDVPHVDVSSPSKFVTEAEKVDGVEEAFRVFGRYHAAVIVHGRDEAHNAAILQRIQGLKNVRRLDVYVGHPGGAPHGREVPAVALPPVKPVAARPRRKR